MPSSNREDQGRGRSSATSGSSPSKKCTNPYLLPPFSRSVNRIAQKESVEDDSMSNANTYYQSSQAPTSSHPIVIDFSFDKPIALAGIRFFSSSFSTAEDRCFPSKIIVLGWRGGEDGTDPVNLPLEDFESSDENKAWNFKELMHDTRWEHLTEAVSLSEPGVSAWSDWVGLDTSANEKTFTYIKDGAPVTSKKQNVFKLYRLIVLDRFGASEEQSIKIGKVALITKAKSTSPSIFTSNIFK